jgi:hypothetical protein
MFMPETDMGPSTSETIKGGPIAMKTKGEAEKGVLARIDGVDLRIAHMNLVVDGVAYMDKRVLNGTKTENEKIGRRDAEKTTNLSVIYLKDSIHHFAPKDNYVVLQHLVTTNVENEAHTRFEEEFSLFLKDRTKGGKVNLTFGAIITGSYNPNTGERKIINSVKLTAGEIEGYVKQLNTMFNENADAYKWLAKQREEKPSLPDLRNLAQK